MNANHVKLATLLERVQHCGVLGHYIFKIIDKRDRKNNALSESQRHRSVHFIKYIIDAHDKNIEEKEIGDITLREYVRALAESPIPKPIQKAYRSGCFAVMQRAWEAATADGLSVGAKPVVRPKSDKRAGASASCGF